MGRLIIDGNRVYELDEVCMQKKKKNAKPPLPEKENRPPRKEK